MGPVNETHGGENMLVLKKAEKHLRKAPEGVPAMAQWVKSLTTVQRHGYNLWPGAMG